MAFENPFAEEGKVDAEEKPREIAITLTEMEPTEKDRLTRKNRILAEHGGLESNVPVNHPEYWRL